MDEDEGFTIKDRRTADKGRAQDQPAEVAASAEGQAQAGTLEEIDFSTFILSLATSAQINLGNVPNPETNQTSQNIPAAKQMIDIIGMLQDKTKGNLGKEEESLLEQVLFNLRMHYVRAMEIRKKSGKS
jgi:uncharacterized protein DUF1844